MIELSPELARAAPGIATVIIGAVGWVAYRRAKREADRRADDRARSL